MITKKACPAVLDNVGCFYSSAPAKAPNGVAVTFPCIEEDSMKKLLILLTLASFVIAAPFAVAQEKAKKADEPKINCCVKGDCKQMTEAKCTKNKGKVVAHCADCKVSCCIKGDCKEMVKAECKKAKGKIVARLH